MPTQENSQLTWDVEPSKKQRMKMLNENFLLTSIKQNKNQSSHAGKNQGADHMNPDECSPDYIARHGGTPLQISNSASFNLDH